MFDYYLRPEPDKKLFRLARFKGGTSTNRISVTDMTEEERTLWERLGEPSYLTTISAPLNGDVNISGTVTLSTTGKSAYEIAKQNGFEGTEQEWLKTLQGKDAYEIAVENGYTGTIQDWIGLTFFANTVWVQDEFLNTSSHQFTLRRPYYDSPWSYFQFSVNGILYPASKAELELNSNTVYWRFDREHGGFDLEGDDVIIRYPS